MPADWKLTKLGAETELLCGFPFSSKQYTEHPSDIRLLRGDNIAQGYIRWTNAKRWPSDDASSFQQYELRKDDVVLAMDRPWIEAGLKYSAIRSDDVPSLLVQRTARLRGGPDLDDAFLRYVIGSPEFTKHIQSITTGSLVPHISARQIQEFTFRKPPLATQQCIAAVLSALDAKIELNQRLNAELEGLAKLLYDYWFVQYDFPISPAQAKAMGKPSLTGKPYRSSGGPMIFHPQLKREIPKGWIVKSISQLVAIGKDTINPSQSPKKLFKLFSIPGFDQTGTYTKEVGSTIGSNKFVVEGGDLLVSKLNPWTNRVIYPPYEDDMICSTEFVVMRSHRPWMKNFLFMLTRDPQFIAYCSQSATGTSNSHKRVNPNVMTGYSVPFDEDAAQQLGEVIHPMLTQRLVLEQQSDHLAQLRDWLLPMLMNGQVTVGKS